MFCSVSPLRSQFLIIPLDELRVLCSESITGRLKKVFIFKRFSVWAFLVVSTNKVCCFFFNFFTLLAVPIAASICFSMTNGDNEVIDWSVFDFMTRNFGNCLV